MLTGALLRMLRHASMRRDSVWKMSAIADPNPAPSLASETCIRKKAVTALRGQE